MSNNLTPIDENRKTIEEWFYQKMGEAIVGKRKMKSNIGRKKKLWYSKAEKRVNPQRLIC